MASVDLERKRRPRGGRQRADCCHYGDEWELPSNARGAGLRTTHSEESQGKDLLASRCSEAALASPVILPSGSKEMERTGTRQSGAFLFFSTCWKQIFPHPGEQWMLCKTTLRSRDIFSYQEGLRDGEQSLEKDVEQSSSRLADNCRSSDWRRGQGKQVSRLQTKT